MQIVINRDWGTFRVPDEVADKIGCWIYADDLHIRMDGRLIEWVEAHKGSTSLKAVEIPYKCTDFEIYNYDGMEQVVYVLNGKLHHEC